MSETILKHRCKIIRREYQLTGTHNWSPIQIQKNIYIQTGCMELSFILSNCLDSISEGLIVFNYIDNWSESKKEKLYDEFLINLNRFNCIQKNGNHYIVSEKVSTRDSDIFIKSRIPTFIYMMKDDVNGFIKIGMSANPQYREKTLQSEKPSIRLIFKHEGYQEDEKQLHQIFDSKRIRGEWFDLTQDEIQKVKNYFKEKRNNHE